MRLRRPRVGPVMAALRRGRQPVLLGSLGATQPISNAWGYDRGRPIDRFYIERFLSAHRPDVTGRVLEVKDSGYTERFGRAVTRRDVLDVDAANAQATIVADLAAADAVPDASFDCFLCTQTLQYVFDVPAALRHAHRILRPGGVLLLTVPAAARMSPAPLTDYWRFTAPAVERLLADAFPGGRVGVEAHGNVLSLVAFLEGLAVEDLAVAELAAADDRFPVVVCARAVRAA